MRGGGKAIVVVVVVAATCLSLVTVAEWSDRHTRRMHMSAHPRQVATALIKY